MQLQSSEFYSLMSNLVQYDLNFAHLHLRPYFNSFDLQMLKIVNKQFSALASDWQKQTSKVTDQTNRAKIFAYNLAKIEKSRQRKPYEDSIELEDCASLAYIESSHAYVFAESSKGLKIFNRFTKTFVNLPQLTSKVPVFYRNYPNDLLVWMDTRQLCVYNLKQARALPLKTSRERNSEAILDFKGNFAHLINNQLIYMPTPNLLKVIDLNDPSASNLINLNFDEAQGALGHAIFEDQVIFWGSNTEKQVVLKVLDKRLNLKTYSLPIEFSGNILSVHFLTQSRLVIKTEREKNYFCQFIQLQADGKTSFFAKPVPYFIEAYDAVNSTLIYPPDEIRIQNGIFSKYSLSHIDREDKTEHFSLFVMYPDLKIWIYPFPHLISYEISKEGVAATPLDKMHPIVWLKNCETAVPYTEDKFINMRYSLLGIFYKHAIFFKDADGMDTHKRKLHIYKMTQETALDSNTEVSSLKPVKVITLSKRSAPLSTNQQNLHYFCRSKKTMFKFKREKLVFLDLDKIIVSNSDQEEFVKVHPEYKIKKNKKVKKIFKDEISLRKLEKILN